MPNHNPTHLVLRQLVRHCEREENQDPGQERRVEDDQTQEAQPGVGVPSAPDVHQRARQRLPEEGYGEERRQAQQHAGRVRQEPGVLRRRAAKRLLEQPGIALHEEDVQDDVEVEGAEVEEGREESPVLAIQC